MGLRSTQGRLSRTNEAQFEIVRRTAKYVVIRDIGEVCRSVTNDAENVVTRLVAAGDLAATQQLYYYDSCGDHAEIRFRLEPDGRCRSVTFCPASPRLDGESY